MSTEGLSLDRFLGGRITAAQPVDGFRAGHDTVLLAAAVPAERGSAALELGAGSGVASLCLAARVPGVRITGLEIDPGLVHLANENAARNGVADRVSFVAADAGGFTHKAGRPGDEGLAHIPLEAGHFDHVFFNPPFHPDSAHISPIAARDRATRDADNAVRDWTKAALAVARDGGAITAIVRADRVKEIVDAAKGYGGIVFPLYPRAGAPPKRAIVQIVKAKGAKWSDGKGLILHEADGRNTEAAERVLRHGAALHLAP